MNDQPMTRRDVVALFAYATLGIAVLMHLLQILGSDLLPHLAPFMAKGVTFPPVGPRILMSLALCLLLPFVSILANAATGQHASRPVSKKEVRSLILPCVGIVMFVTPFPYLVRSAYTWFTASSASSASVRPIYLIFIAISLLQISFGFSLAFFPPIFASLRHRMRDEPNETAA